jgi:hypothetical protein
MLSAIAFNDQKIYCFYDCPNDNPSAAAVVPELNLHYHLFQDLQEKLQ